MKTIYLIETHPVNKTYFDVLSQGYICETSIIDDAKHFDTYEDASKVLKDIITGDYESCYKLYLSIVSYKVIS